MVKPSIAELSHNNRYNRYTLVMAAAKGARYVIEKENYAKEHPEYEQYKALTTGKKIEKTDEKPVKEAINMLYNGEIFIKTPGEEFIAEETEEETAAAEETAPEAEVSEETPEAEAKAENDTDDTAAE